MEPLIKIHKAITLIGFRTKMSFANHSSFSLWNRFMPERKTMHSLVSNDLFSVEVFPKNYFDSFDPEREFEKWAAVEVSSTHAQPDEMEVLQIPEGLYAVFLHKGPASEGARTYKYIFTEWLPRSGYTVDNRPHFAIMGEKYKQNELHSEEEIWIPVLKNE